MRKPFVLQKVIQFFVVALLISGITTTVLASQKEPQVILRLHGSNTIGAKLAPAMGIAFLKEVMLADNVQVIPLATNELRLLTQMPGGPIAIDIAAHGSSTSFKDLAAGKCDIGMASRPIKKKEKSALSFMGNMDTFFSEHTLGLDGLAVIVHPDNPLTSLPMAKLRDIFSGKITDWADLTPQLSGPIQVYARDDKSGTYDTFKSLVLGKKSPLTGSAKRYESNTKLSDAVADAKYGIGFTGLPYILRAKPLSIADKGAAPIMPSNNSVATEDYPLSRRLYFYTPPYPENKYSRVFIDFALSSRGQNIVEEIGFIGQNIRTFAEQKKIQGKVQQKKVVGKLRKATERSHRVSLNFRFQQGSTKLDDRSERDLLRLARFLKDRQSKKGVILIGFTDSAGQYTTNYNLARKRAGIVYRRLQQLGANGSYHILSGGEELPVATNDTLKGRQKNRRVEVWLLS